MPTSREVAAKARWHAENTNWGVGYCLKFARSCAGAPANTYDAATAWRQATHRHTTGTPPLGAMVFWTGGSRGHGHIAVSDGGGYVWSTDIIRPGRVDRVSIARLGATWGNLTYVGWTEDVNGVLITGFPTPPPLITVALKNLQPGVRHPDVAELQTALRRHGLATLNPSGVTGYYGTETQTMVTAFQRKQGWAGADADGLPGPKTCAFLGLHVV